MKDRIIDIYWAKVPPDGEEPKFYNCKEQLPPENGVYLRTNVVEGRERNPVSFDKYENGKWLVNHPDEMPTIILG